MESALIRERYKVVRVLYTAENYALAEAVDIQDRETPVYLLNLYEGELLHRYGKIFSTVDSGGYASFHRVFLEGATLVAVFSSSSGENIDSLFYSRDQWEWRERLEYAEILLHEAMTLVNLPPELSCAVLLSENVFFLPKDKKIQLRCKILPMEDMNPRELTLLVSDQLKKILPRKLRSVDAELDFMERLDTTGFPTMVPFYAAWRTAREQITQEYEAWEKKGFIRRWLAVFLRRIKRRWKRR